MSNLLKKKRTFPKTLFNEVSALTVEPH